MSPARLLAVLLLSSLLACTGSGPVEPDPQGPALPATALGESTVGAPFSRSLASSQGAAPLSYAVQGLPSGITLNAQTGALSGAPTVAGSFDIDASVTDAAGRSDQRRYPLVVLQAPRFVTASLPPATTAVTYVARVEASGGKAPLVYALGGGAFPAGLSIDASGTLSGTPSAPGTSTFELSVTDAHGAVTRASFTLEVRPPAPTVVTTELPSAHGNRAYRFTLAASGGTPPYSWSKVEGELPSGLGLSSTGELSGTPSTGGTFSFTAEVRDSRGQSAQKPLSLVVIPPLVLTTQALPDAYRGTAYAAGLEASGGVAPYSYSVVTGSLPGGVQFDNAGRFSGTPSVSGAFNITLTVQDTSQQSLTRAFSLTAYEPPGFATSTLRDGAVGTAYSETLQPSGGKAPFTFRLTAGALPAGLQLQGNAITGTPTTLGTASFTVEIRDANNRTGTQAFTLRVPSTLAISTPTLPEGDTGFAYSAQLTATGGQGTLSWSFTGTLPPGLSLSSSGLLGGTPTAAGSFSFTARVTDATSSTDSRTLTLVIQGPPVITTSVLPDGYSYSPYSATLAASGGRAPYSWSATGPLPPGVTLSPSGIFSGTPTSWYDFSFTARVTDSLGRSHTRSVSLHIYNPPTVFDTFLGDGYVSESYTQSLSAAEGKPPYTFAVSSGSLPAGLSLSPAGELTGTLTSAGTATFNIQVTDANGRTGTRTLSLAVYTQPTFVTASLPEAVQNQSYFQRLTVSGGKPDYFFSVDWGSVPAGLTLDSGGVISGVPSGSTEATFIVRFFDANGRSDSRVFTLAVYVPPRIVSSTLPDATVGTYYEPGIVFAGNREPFTWSSSGELPPGLSFNSVGRFFGTPTASGTWSFTVTLQDGRGATDSRPLTVTVRPQTPDGGSPDGGYPDGGPTDGGYPDGGSTDGGYPDGGYPDGGPTDGGYPDGGPTDGGSTDGGSGELFTVGHWNIEWFGSDTQGPPRSTSQGGTLDDLQIANALEILGTSSVNLWGLVEMVDTNDFLALKAQLPGYDGFLSNDQRVAFGSNYYTPSGQKLGVLYDNRLTFQSATLILLNSANDFGGRPPMRVDFVTSIHGVNTPLTVIVLHMKAFDDQASYDKRQRAAVALKNYLDTNLSTQHVLVLGDWNDDVDVSITDSSSGTPLPTPYEGFVADSSNYTFVTRPLSLAGETSTIGFPDMIDHTLASNEVMEDYVSNSAQVLRPGWISDYGGTTSDHYPVVSRYDFAGTGLLPVTLTGPASGTYAGGSTVAITWDAPPNLGPVGLYYTVDYGSSWTAVAYLADPSVGSYQWTLPNLDADNVHVLIFEAQAPGRYDVSDAPLTLVYVPPANSVFINEFLPNEPSGTLPDGTVGALVDYEFVELVNTGPEAVDLSGWTLWDGNTTGGPRHVFPSGTVLMPGRAWVIYGGPTAFTPGTPNTQAASSGRLGLNNTGTDYVILRNASGTLVNETVYSSTVDNVSFNREVDANPDTGFVLHTNLSDWPSSAGTHVDHTPF